MRESRTSGSAVGALAATCPGHLALPTQERDGSVGRASSSITPEENCEDRELFMMPRIWVNSRSLRAPPALSCVTRLMP